jgi:phage terminase large subunit-like protein
MARMMNGVAMSAHAPPIAAPITSTTRFAITDIFASGNVFAQKDKSFAQEVIEEVAAFPSGENDDYVDTVAHIMHRFRAGGWVKTQWDEEEDEERDAIQFQDEFY